ncbi:MAG: uroporphyrinogen-III synthase [Candidatus Latescibacterota bacterium]
MGKPLANRTIVVTRDAHQAETLVQEIAHLGGRALAFPTIKISEPADWGPCDLAIGSVAQYDWAVFASVNSVRGFFGRARQLGISEFEPQIAAVGKRTVAEIERNGFHVTLTPSVFSAAGLLASFRDFDLHGQRMLLPASSIARDELHQGLVGQGARVDRVVVYQILPNDSLDTKKMGRALREGRIDCLTFFSPSAFHSFCALLGEDMLHAIKSERIAIAAIGSTTAEAIRTQGLDVAIVPEQSTEAGLVTALSKHYGED